MTRMTRNSPWPFDLNTRYVPSAALLSLKGNCLGSSGIPFGAHIRFGEFRVRPRPPRYRLPLPLHSPCSWMQNGPGSLRARLVYRG